MIFFGVEFALIVLITRANDKCSGLDYFFDGDNPSDWSRVDKQVPFYIYTAAHIVSPQQTNIDGLWV